MPIHRILYIACIKNQVTIFRVGHVIDIRTINSVLDIEGFKWNFFYQLKKLDKKWFRKIVFHSMIHWIPLITYPNFFFINFYPRQWRKTREYFSPIKITFSLIQHSLISESHPPLHATHRAKGWRWHLHFFVKIKILFFYNKFIITILTYFSFHIYSKIFLSTSSGTSLT